MAQVYPGSDTAPSPALGTLIAVFARDANLTFGGGTATGETLRRELVERRGWLSDADFRLAFAAARMTPATNLLALCTAIGWRLRGAVGAVAALLASSIPSAVIATVVMAGYEGAEGYPLLTAALRGTVAVSVALLVSSVWALVKPYVVAGKRLRAALIMTVAWTAHEMLGASALTVLAGAALLGALWEQEATP